MSASPTLETHPDPAATVRKNERRSLRRQGIERRQVLSADALARHSAAICAHLQAHFSQLAGMRVGFCWPIQNEPDLRPLMQEWLAAGKPEFTALLPVVIEANTALAFRVWTPACPMSDDRYGIPSPSEGEFIIPQALLIPVNAFDAQGYRLGYGGGFFDRTLTSLKPRPLTIGIGFELARVDSIHAQPHDIRLDVVVTEAGVFRTAE